MNESNMHPSDVLHVHPLLRRLTSVGDVSTGDAAILLDAQRSRLKINAGRDLLRAGQKLQSVYVVQSGWLMLHWLFDDGRRQILGIALPGDVIGEFAAFRHTAQYNVTALTDSELATMQPMAFLGLGRKSAALAQALGTNTARSFSILGDQVLRLGRLSAFERHAHLILELWYRCQDNGEEENGWIPWPLKQNDIADLLGLSLVHVNRTIMQLKRQNLIRIDKRRLQVIDPDRLREIAGVDPLGARQKAA